jgi:hypothetical protein
MVAPIAVAPVANNGAFLALYHQAPIAVQDQISHRVWTEHKDDPLSNQPHFGETYINGLSQGTYNALSPQLQDTIAFETCTVALANAVPGAPIPGVGAVAALAMRAFVNGMLP